MKKQHIKEIIMEKLNRAQKCSILGPQNLGSRGGRAPGPHPWIRTSESTHTLLAQFSSISFRKSGQIIDCPLPFSAGVTLENSGSATEQPNSRMTCSLVFCFLFS